MNIVFIDRETFGQHFDPMNLSNLGHYKEYGTSSKDALPQRIEQAQVVITTRTPLRKDVLQYAKNLKLIVACAVGTNHIDIEFCQQNNIEVKNCPDYSTQTVAQHTVALALNLLRNIKGFDLWIKQENWTKDRFAIHSGLDIEDLHTKTWGIIGLGNIGQKVAQLAAAFGCDVLYYSTSGKNKNKKYQQVSLAQLAQESDVISIHCPLNEQTKNLIDQSVLEKLKDNAVVINVARGGVIDEQALLRAFTTKNLRLGLDVVAKEPLREQSPLYELTNSSRVIFTPHVAWASRQAKDVLSQMVRSHIESM